MPKFLNLSDDLLTYVEGVCSPETEAQRLCRSETAAMGRISGMQIGPDQGAFLQMLVRLMGARHCLEIGVFTGYSALSVALALPADGTIDACDVSEDFTFKARRYWEAGGVADKIALHLAPATQTLEGFVREGRAGMYDFAFIDADKASYGAYYELCLTLLRPGGLIAVDNALWSGKVADPAADDADTAAIRALNAQIAADPRVTAAMLTVGDGLMLARKTG
jgi:caffeoyl-CoA O-methyltransferase